MELLHLKKLDLANKKVFIRCDFNVPMDEFDECAKKSNSDIQTAGDSGGLVPSFAHGMAQGNTMKAALQDVVTEHFNSDMSSVDAANAIADAVLDNM